jgi:hypothetical protein
MEHRRHAENHVYEITNFFQNHSCQNQMIAGFNQSIRDNQAVTDSVDHDMFDPSMSVKWGEENNSGFLTQNESPVDENIKK